MIDSTWLAISRTAAPFSKTIVRPADSRRGPFGIEVAKKGVFENLTSSFLQLAEKVRLYLRHAQLGPDFWVGERPEQRREIRRDCLSGLIL